MTFGGVHVINLYSLRTDITQLIDNIRRTHRQCSSIKTVAPMDTAVVWSFVGTWSGPQKLREEHAELKIV